MDHQEPPTRAPLGHRAAALQLRPHRRALQRSIGSHLQELHCSTAPGKLHGGRITACAALRASASSGTERCTAARQPVGERRNVEPGTAARDLHCSTTPASSTAVLVPRANRDEIHPSLQPNVPSQICTAPSRIPPSRVDFRGGIISLSPRNSQIHMPLFIMS